MVKEYPKNGLAAALGLLGGLVAEHGRDLPADVIRTYPKISAARLRPKINPRAANPKSA